MNRALIGAVVVTFAACAQYAPASEGGFTAPKVVTEGTLCLEVADLAVAESKVVEWVASRGGSIASTRRSAANPRATTLTVRVPTATFRETIAAVSTMGAVSSLSTDSRDVTAEYFDGAARISAKQVEEGRLLRLLDTSSASLQDVLAVEKELARVRGEIEELLGRKKVLDATTTTSALVVVMTERRDEFASSVGSTIASSTMALLRTARMLGIVAAAMLPWVLTLLACVAPVVVLRRRSRRKAGQS